jgi:hypothetical protein
MVSPPKPWERAGGQSAIAPPRPSMSTATSSGADASPAAPAASVATNSGITGGDSSGGICRPLLRILVAHDLTEIASQASIEQESVARLTELAMVAAHLTAATAEATEQVDMGQVRFDRLQIPCATVATIALLRWLRRRLRRNEQLRWDGQQLRRLRRHEQLRWLRRDGRHVRSHPPAFAPAGLA